MVNVTFERRFGSATVKSRVTAPSIERAVELAGEGAHIVFPIESARDAHEDIENLAGPVRMELAT